MGTPSTRRDESKRYLLAAKYVDLKFYDKSAFKAIMDCYRIKEAADGFYERAVSMYQNDLKQRSEVNPGIPGVPQHYLWEMLRNYDITKDELKNNIVTQTSWNAAERK